MVGEPVEADLPHLEDVISSLRRVLSWLDADALSADDARSLVGGFAEVERLAAAGRTMAAGAVERLGAWKASGHRSAAHWVADATGVSVGQAVETVSAARSLAELPEVSAAFRSGDLAEVRLREVAAAAQVVPEAQGELLEAARSLTVVALRQTCQRVRAEATDAEARYARIHRSRCLRWWTDREGVFRLEGRLTPDDGARVLAGLDPHRRRLAREARAVGRRESSQAIAADALVVMAGGDARPPAAVQVRVEHTAREDRCEVPGIGPVPVAAAHRLVADAVVRLVQTEGADVTGVVHLGRTVPARVRTALEARDPTCVVPGCDARDGLEIDHYRVPFAMGGPASVDNLARLCAWHHRQKTHFGWRLGGGPGAWTWSGPDPPDDG